MSARSKPKRKNHLERWVLALRPRDSADRAFSLGETLISFRRYRRLLLAKELHGIPFRRDVSERGHGLSGRIPVQLVELKAERFAMAYRLDISYAFVRPESEQNCSLLVHVYIRVRAGVRRNTTLSDRDALLRS
jgi:hypothetical protein